MNIMFFVELCNGKYSGPYYTVICCVGGRGESDRGHESIAGGGRNGVRTPQVTSPTYLKGDYLSEPIFPSILYDSCIYCFNGLFNSITEYMTVGMF